MPTDLEQCEREKLTNPPDRDLDLGETETFWKTDRRKAVKLRNCVRRAVCQIRDTRRTVGGVQDEPVCVNSPQPIAGDRTR